jgi:hypothetical protein
MLGEKTMAVVPATLRKFRAIATGTLAAALVMITPEVSAAPIIGGQLYWTGGDVTVTVQASTAGYTSDLTLFSADPDLVIANNKQTVGTVATIGAASIGLNHHIGDELIFGIFVRDTLDTFLMGAGTRNADLLEHATVDDLGGGLFRVGFEDLLGGGDLDYDDNVFLFQGGVAIIDPNDPAVPEPGTLALLGLSLGLVGLAGGRRRKQ